MQSHIRRVVRFFLHRWHRRIGLFSALLVLLLSVTGILLNHTDKLHLAENYPQSSILLWPYLSTIETSVVYETEQGRVTAQNNELLLGDQVLAPCSRLLQMATTLEGNLLACEFSWYIFDPDWQLIESIDPSLLGLMGDEAIGTFENRLAVKLDSGWQELDLLSMTLGRKIETAQQLPLQTVSYNSSISWQRVLLDMHSGRWFGAWGVWVMDLVAVFLLLLAASGVWIWWSKPRH